jgi:hypothetical protein
VRGGETGGESNEDDDDDEGERGKKDSVAGGPPGFWSRLGSGLSAVHNYFSSGLLNIFIRLKCTFGPSSIAKV